MKQSVFFVQLFVCIAFLAPNVPAVGQGHQEPATRIAWDYSSMMQLADRGGYPRFARLHDSSIIVIYETSRGSIHLKRSSDEGGTWTAPTEVFSQFVYTSLEGKSVIVNTANPELKQLKNGDLIIACNYRPSAPEVAPFSIVIRRSTDNGKTWLPPQSLYSAAPRFIDGCWEPAFLQLPNGELQVYFANENPYQRSDEQEISMISSNDNGITWTKKIKTISFRAGRRDGMPVPVLVGDEIVVSIEDNKIGQFKPYTVRTSISDNWREPVLANSHSRNYALAEPVSDSVYMGAPYLIQLPNGETLLSYQTNENRAHDWELSTMEVAIGNNRARNFRRKTRPFDLPLDKQAKWNSIALWDERTVVALSASNVGSDYIAPWLIKGHMVSDIYLDRSHAENRVFVGAKGPANLRAKILETSEGIAIKCIVSNLEQGGESAAVLFFATKRNAYRLESSANGINVLFLRRSGKWIQAKLTNQIVSEVTPLADGYEINWKIPMKLNSSKTDAVARLGMALEASYRGASYIEYLSHMDANNPGTWLRIFK
ncbi:sialidase family protein [Arcticibacter sp.]|jgi:hypothetical protein|uniref:sialidase family protein n=1 Tax=Arcticibacter sp. TaxID=1872630 RepID=UPI00388EB4ED